MRSLVTPDAAATAALGARVGARLFEGAVVLLTGDLGAGKTCFTQGLARALGVDGPVQSPTFVLARTHPSLVGGPPLVHVDAYRLGDAMLLDDLDLDFDHSVVVVEWGAGLVDDVGESLLEIVIERPGGGHEVTMTDAADADALGGDEPRVLEVRGYGPRWAGSGYSTAQ